MSFLESLIDGLSFKVRAGRYYQSMRAQLKPDGYIDLYFGYNKELLDQVKTRFHPRKWDADNKCWRIELNQRNIFQLDALRKGGDPYAKWDEARKALQDKSHPIYTQLAPYVEAIEARNPGLKICDHQIEMTALILLTQACIVGGEMGTGKTLASILALEILDLKKVIWTAPNTPLESARVEFRKWKCPVTPTFITIDSMRRFVKNATEKDIPQALFIDESSRCKTLTSQRTVACRWLADEIREMWGPKATIVELSGRPNPNTPIDWYAQCEIARPGFITEGNVFHLQNRLAIQEEGENQYTGQTYKKLVTWLDDENKCRHCGRLQADVRHTSGMCTYAKSVNEVSKLGDRLNGLVGIWFKEDVTDLPTKKYDLRTVEPSQSLLTQAAYIVKTETRAVDVLIKLQMLSDGFLYEEEIIGHEKCIYCDGDGHRLEWIDPENPWDLLTQDEKDQKFRFCDDERIDLIQEKIKCPACLGEGERPKYKRHVKEIDSPKFDAAREIFESYKEYGRFVTYAYFTGSLDRLEKGARKDGWHVIRVDGKGWKMSDPKGNPINIRPDEMLEVYQDRRSEFREILFLGQSGAASMGITLTASLAALVYSNSFKLEDRIQLEARIHRLGMDERGGTIIDLVQLPSDLHVVNSLKRKNDLSLMPMSTLQQIYGV